MGKDIIRFPLVHPIQTIKEEAWGAATAYTDPPTGTMRQHARVTLYKETQKCGFDGVPQ